MQEAKEINDGAEMMQRQSRPAEYGNLNVYPEILREEWRKGSSET